MNVLLHICCAPCSISCIEMLREDSIEPAGFWFNPNIHPYTEYRSRKNTLIRHAENIGLNLTVQDEYGLRPFVHAIYPGLENRCEKCYRMRFEATARHAAENRFTHFSSTLFISPYQNHDLMVKTAEEAAVKYGVGFLYRDFRPRFREGQQKAREQNLYMQKYCGCIFSEEERYLNGKKTDK